MKASCPICHKKALKGFAPFCSQRCSDLDLAHWLKGTYAVPVVETDDEDAPDLPDQAEEH